MLPTARGRRTARAILPAVIVSVIGGCAVPAKTISATPGQHPAVLEKTVLRTVRLPYLLYVPHGAADAGRTWPLILFLHGSGERGGDIEVVKRNGPPKLLAAGQEMPFVVVSPQLPAGGDWSPEDLVVLLDDLQARLPVDPDRVYLTGLSLGGRGAWRLAARYPERFAAVVPVCGWGDPEVACRLTHVPIWAFHGAKDTVVPLADEQEMVDAVKKCGGDVRFTVYPDAGHDAWSATYANPELYTWLLAHTRRY